MNSSWRFKVPNATPKFEGLMLHAAREVKTLAHWECFGISVLAQDREMTDFDKVKEFWDLLDDMSKIELTRRSSCHTQRLLTQREALPPDHPFTTQITELMAHFAVQPFRQLLTFVEFMSFSTYIIITQNRSKLTVAEAVVYYNTWIKLDYEDKLQPIKPFLQAVPPLITDY